MRSTSARKRGLSSLSRSRWESGWPARTLLAFEGIAESNPSVSLLSTSQLTLIMLCSPDTRASSISCSIKSKHINSVSHLSCFFLLQTTNRLRNRLSGPASIINLYGSSDGGILGFELPLTIAIRHQARDNASLKDRIELKQAG